MVDLLVIPDFLDDSERRALLAALEAAAAAPATVTGEGDGARVNTNVRRADRIALPEAEREAVRDRIRALRADIERHFGVALDDCEAPQFLRYREGDYFVAHQDGNTSVIRDDTRHRRISAVLMLSPRSEAALPGTYGGGALVFHGAYPDWEARHPAPAEPGTLVLFRAETTHEVTPVTHGVRYSVATWFRGREG